MRREALRPLLGAGGGFLLGVIWMDLLFDVQLVRERMARRWAALAVVLAASPIGLGILRVVPNAMRLGRGLDPPAVQASLARSICIEHLACFALMAGFVTVIALAPGRPRDR